MKKQKLKPLESLANAAKFAIRDPETVLGGMTLATYVVAIPASLGYLAYSGVNEFFAKNPEIPNNLYQFA